MLELFHVVADLDGDALMLQQVDHSGNYAAIAMDVSQLRIIAERFLPKSAVPDAKPAVPDAIGYVMEEHSRLLTQLGDEIDELRCERLGYFDEIAEYCASGTEITLKIRNLADLAYSLERHLLVLMPLFVRADAVPPAPTFAKTERDDIKPPAVESDGNSVTEIKNVTSKPTKRGRPKTSKALSGAERQARYLQRKAENQTNLFQQSSTGVQHV